MGQIYSPLHLILVGNYAHDGQESMQRYADLLGREFIKRGTLVSIIRPTPRFGALKPDANGFGKWLGYIDKFLLFPRELRRSIYNISSSGERPFVHICDHSNAFYIKHIQDVAHVITCHDLLAIRSAMGHFSQNRTGWSGRRLQKLILEGLRAARQVICVSSETRKQMLELGGFDPKKSLVVYNPLNYHYRPLTSVEVNERLAVHAAARKLLDRRFVMHVGGNQWYKHRIGVLRIYEMLRNMDSSEVLLVMAGKMFSSELAAAVMSSRYKRDIINLEFVDNETLNALYVKTECLLFPSLYEGFGWPILEALAAGGRVAASGRAPITEIGGDAITYLDPSNYAASAQIVREVLNEDASRRCAMRSAGLERATLFSSKKTIATLNELYHNTTKENN